jgi:hypothetical protein
MRIVQPLPRSDSEKASGAPWKSAETFRCGPSVGRCAVAAFESKATNDSRAKRLGLLSAIVPCIEEMRRQGVWLSDRLVDRVRREAGEN